MPNTLTENLINDVAAAVQIKLAALDNSISAYEKTAVDWGALATQAKNAITSPEMGNILRQANQRGLRLGTMSGVINGVKGGINGAIQGYRGAGPGAWNKIKGTMGGSLKGQLTGTAKGFGGGYAAGAGGSIIGDALTGTKDMQALKGMFNNGNRIKAPAVKSDGIFNIDGSGLINDMDKHYLKNIVDNTSFDPGIRGGKINITY